MKYYGTKNNKDYGFYENKFDGAIEISDEQWVELLDKQNNGYVIILYNGNVISVKEKSQSLAIIKGSLEITTVVAPYLSLDKEHFSGTFVRLPERSELTRDINESLIVEYYNRLL